MVKTGAIYFWFGGIIAPSVPELLWRALPEFGKSDVNLLALPGFSSLCEALALGHISSLSFCGMILENVGLAIDPGLLEGEILKQIYPNPETLQTIGLLPNVDERWLVVDYPPAWFESAAEQLGVRRSFKSEQIIQLVGSGLERLMPDALDLLAGNEGVPPSKKLFIDASARRAIQALRCGMQAAIYINPWRLEREFTMRYLIPGQQPVHRPGGSY